MIEIYGRPDSSAVARLMWTVQELDLPHRRFDRGGDFGGLDLPEYKRMNPAGTIPAVRLPDGRTLWESNAIIRFLAEQYDPGGLSPVDPVMRAQAEAWMDWSSAFGRAVGVIRSAYRTPSATVESCQSAIAQAGPVIAVLDQCLTDGPGYVASERLTIADLSLGVIAHRLIRCPTELGLARFAAIADWHARLCERQPFRDMVVALVSVRSQLMAGRIAE